MPRNVEIKARVDDVEALEARVKAFADSGPLVMQQDDTFFHCPNGRLKLREISETKGELIFYQRPDQQGPKESRYIISPASSPAALREALTLALGASGRVRKRRTVYMIGNTRIHLDKVEGLGDFLEFEVVLGDGDTVKEGEAIADDLLERLRVSRDDLVEGAYVDLIRQEKTHDR